MKKSHCYLTVPDIPKQRIQTEADQGLGLHQHLDADLRMSSKQAATGVREQMK